MSLSWSSLGAALVLTPALVASVAAQPLSIEGLWQQVETNAGSCPHCRIEVMREGGALRIIANNGWSAALGGKGGTERFDGHGAWLPEAGGWVASRPFDIRVRSVDHRLYIGMRVRMLDGSVRAVDAVFKRVWLGV